MLHGQQVLTGRHTGTAVHDGLCGLVSAQVPRELRAERFWWQHRVVIGQVRPVRVIRGTGNVTGQPVKRFNTTFESFRSAGVQQERSRILIES